MLLKRIYDEDLAQASWLIGCQAAGAAVVVDPRRDVDVYLDAAKKHRLRIAHVTETHVHADYLSGARELARATGASLRLSAEGGPEWSYRFDHLPLVHGDEIRVGDVVLTAVHTPGHTPEHLSFLLRDGAAADRPGWILTGDFVFVGDVGRPDLLDETRDAADTREPMARRLYRSLRDRLLPLADWVRILPGHGAGSACGKALGAVDTTTVGYERRYAWWADALVAGDEDGFVRALLEGQPDAPAYFGRMKRWNLRGPDLLAERAPLRRFDAAELRERANRDLILLDTRDRATHLRDAPKGALFVPFGGSFVTYAAYAIDPERDDRGIVVLAPDAATADAMRRALARVGLDRVEGYVADVEGLERDPVPTVRPEELEGLGEPLVLDVRTRSEHDEGRIPGSTQVHVGRLAARLDSLGLPEDRPIVVHCQSGGRATVAEAILRAAGYRNVVDLEGSYAGWRATVAAAEG